MKVLKLLVPLVMLASCASANRQQNESQMCGAYTAQREPTEEEVAIFRQVTGEGDMVLTPLSVSTQVVAGLNYKFWCRYQDSVHDAYGHCWVVIYKDLDGNATLTGITKEE